MADAVAHFLAAFKACSGYVTGAGALAAVLFLSQLIFCYRWASYPTRAEYLAALRQIPASRHI